MQNILENEGTLFTLQEVWPLFYGINGLVVPPISTSQIQFVFTSNQGPILNDPRYTLRTKIIRAFSSSKKKDDWYLTSDLCFRHLLLISPTGQHRSWVLDACLSITLHEDHIYLRRIYVRNSHRRKRLGTFLVSAAQQLFSPPPFLLAVDLRHPSNTKQYQQALENTSYLFFVHGLHFQLAPNQPSHIIIDGSIQHIHANTESLVNPHASSSPSTTRIHWPYYCNWQVMDVLPDQNSLKPWQMFDRLFRYSFDAFKVWKPTCNALPCNQVPTTAHFLTQLSRQLTTLPICNVGDGVDLDDSDSDYKLHVDRLNSVLRIAATHVGYNIKAIDLGVGSLPYFFHGFDDDPNPHGLPPEKSCFYVVACHILFNSQQNYTHLRRCVARFIRYLGYIPTDDPIWCMSITRKLYEMILGSIIEMELDMDDGLKEHIKAITLPMKPPDEWYSRPSDQLSPDQLYSETQAFMEKFWKENVKNKSLVSICEAMAEVIIDPSHDSGELEILFASIILHSSFVLLRATKVDKDNPNAYSLAAQMHVNPPNEFLQLLRQRLPPTTQHIQFVTQPVSQYIFVGFLSYGHYISLDLSPVAISATDHIAELNQHKS